MKIKLYLETSIFGFYFDKQSHNKEKNESTIKLFQLIKDNYYEGFISNITIKEINNVPERYKNDFLSLIKKYNLKILEHKENNLDVSILQTQKFFEK
jgi:hypothetical protein